MDKKEILFVLILVIAYIACSIMLKLPTIVNVIFIIALILFLFATLIMKVQENYENEKVSSVSRKICSILVALYILVLISGFVFKIALFKLHMPILTLILITLFISWFFKEK